MSDIAKKIDHTILRPEAVSTDVETLCREALEYQFASVVVHPFYLGIPAKLLAGSGVRTGTVVDFCFGAHPVNVNIFEAEDAVRRGADDLDMVINIGLLKAGRYDEAEADIRAVVEHGRAVWREIYSDDKELVVKVIIEAGFLSNEEKEIACRLVVSAGADFVKTSTGYFGTGATKDDVALMRRIVGPDFGVKASGGIRTLAQAEAMVAAGADRIGTSAAMAIMSEWQERKRSGAAF